MRVFWDKSHDAVNEEFNLEFPKEIVEMRRENYKVFDAGDGTTVAQFYDKDICYYDIKSDKYLEIDNSIREEGEKFVADNGRFKVQFNRSLRDGKIYTMQKNNCGVILFSPDLAATGVSIEKVKNDDYAAENNNPADNKVVIRGIKNNADVVYAVEHDRVIENIIVHSKENKYEFSFELALENVYARASKDGKQLELRNTESSCIEFIILAPSMTDANGDYSDSVYYEIEQVEDKLLRCKVIADKDWINASDRAFPVAIESQLPLEDQFKNGSYGDSDYDNPIFAFKVSRNDRTTSVPVVSGAIRVVAGVNGLYGMTRLESELIINKNRIPSHIVNHIRSAKLRLSVSMPTRGPFVANHEFFNFEENQIPSTIELDVTNNFNWSLDNEIEVPFRTIVGRDHVETVNLVLSNPVLTITYNNSVESIEIVKPLSDDVVKEYWPGVPFNPQGISIIVNYNNGDKSHEICVMNAVSGDNPGFSFEPAGTLSDFDKGVLITYHEPNSQNTSHSAFLNFEEAGIKIHEGFNDRRPTKGMENIYRIFESNNNGGFVTESRLVRLELADNPISEGTALNAKNLNNMFVRAENIVGKIKKENLPD